MDAATNDAFQPAPTESSHKLLGSSDDPNSPLIICFHGSGESCEPSWSELARLLSPKYRVLLFERGSSNPKPPQATSDLLRFLKTRGLRGPYILVAHSYGGAFARMFIHKAPTDVAGAVLVETGQEGGLDPKMAAAQTRKQVLEDRPVSVIRGNSFLDKTKSLEESEKMAVTEQQKAALNVQRQLLQASDKEDERMKKTQLLLSKNARYVHIPDCGHNVIRDRPATVAGEVDWIWAHAAVPKRAARWRTLMIKLESALH